MWPEASQRFSIIVATRERPRSLLRTLRAIRQLDYPNFEVVVVGDALADDALSGAEWGWLRFVRFDQPNLSAARNAGVAAAAGDVLAFIDDDAVPEPTWLTHHDSSLLESGATASVGFVRGPDGIRFQSRFHSIDREARTHDERADGESPFVPDLPEGRAVKLIGANMAIRSDVLRALGGFDSNYHYFLEDSDISLRLSDAGHRSVVTPLAEVHHSLEPSCLRTARRAPRTLFDVGRSAAIFLRRHSREPVEEFLEFTAKDERKRAVDRMIRGDLEPGDIRRLMHSLRIGWSEGISCSLECLPRLPTGPEIFLKVSPLPAGHQVLVSRRFGRASALRHATDLARRTARASVFSFSLTSWRHTVRYTERGVWLHAGGQFRETESTGRRFRWCRFARRADEEIDRVAKRRGLDDGK
jgi:GT2 family glycosyltransferase